MKKLWITYSWADNERRDVDFIAQELQSIGIEVRLDRWTVSAGARLWDQIAEFIDSEEECDAWLLVATENSLASEACAEEFAYALNRALRARGDGFPVIALFPRRVDQNLIPPAIRVRLHVSLSDPEWKERIRSAVEGDPLDICRRQVDPYEMEIHRGHPTARTIVELRPRAGRWHPVLVAVPISERDATRPMCFVEPSGNPTGTGMVPGSSEKLSEDGNWWVVVSNQQATPTESLYVWLDSLPSRLIFGAVKGPHYVWTLEGE